MTRKQPSTDRIEIREHPKRVADMKRAAELDGENFSSWARHVLWEAALRVLIEHDEKPIR